MADLIGLLRGSGLYSQYEVADIHPDLVRMPYANATLNMQKIGSLIGQYLEQEVLLISSDLEKALGTLDKEKAIARPKSGRLRAYCIPDSTGNGNFYINLSENYKRKRLYDAISPFIVKRYKGLKIVIKTHDSGSDNRIEIDKSGKLIGRYKGPWIYFRDEEKMLEFLESRLTEVKEEGKVTLTLNKLAL